MRLVSSGSWWKDALFREIFDEFMITDGSSLVTVEPLSCPDRSFARSLDNNLRSFKSTNGAGPLSDFFFGGAASEKSVTKFNPTGFATFFRFFMIPRILCRLL
jgi:hypothetical protein